MTILHRGDFYVNSTGTVLFTNARSIGIRGGDIAWPHHFLVHDNVAGDDLFLFYEWHEDEDGDIVVDYSNRFGVLLRIHA